jgi:hypothetical protein
MARKTANRDEDIDPQAIARWNDEGGAPRPLKCGASRFPGRENRAADVSHDLWRFSCEFPDAPYLFNNLTPP